MRKIYLILIMTSLYFNFSCSSDLDSDSTNGTSMGSNIQEITQAKQFYSDNGGAFKFRLYYFPPSEGSTTNNNNQAAEINKILDYNGIISVIAKYTLFAQSIQSYGAVVNCQGDFISPQTSTAVGLQSQYFNDDFEVLANNNLVSYSHSNSSFEGNYGYAGASYHNHTLNTHNGPTSASTNQGYMGQFNNQFFMLSMGLNSNYGHPMLYNNYNPNTGAWSGTAVSQMDWVQGVMTNLPTTNHASKAGNTDKIFWAWLSFNTTTDNGKINIINYNGSAFSAVTSLDGIGSVGTGLSMEYKHSIHLCKNPNNLSNPYMVVRRYNTDVLDIYKFTGTAIEVVKTGISLPVMIPITSGTTRVYKEIVFSGSSIYLITGKDKYLYKLSGNTFVVDKPNLTQANETISALESTSNGILVSIVKSILSTPQPKMVSDVVLIPN
ncbi:hypothetical protein [Flavobacterium nitratireducens]|uniref:hypothetical protein n=1 Tax=Flavobacterium nitratireducens TaxID=992289 RepID=UPI002415368E|nr:hypothetical protein [Flavobacterium nitratireducens]